MSRRRMQFLILAVLASLSTAVLVPALSRATPLGRTGEIAFARFRFVNSPLREEIWVVSPNGSGLKRLTRVSANVTDSSPTWSRDGSKLLFVRCAPRNGHACEGRQTIWSVDADGSHLHMLSRACRRTGSSRSAFARCPDDAQAAYSPDGHRIAYLRYTGIPEIAVADTNLRHVHPLLPFGKHGVPDIDGLAWSPDGTQLAFTVHNDTGKRFKPVGGRAVFVVDLDGSGLRRVTPWKLHAGGLGELDWSPDGRNILFRSYAAHGLGPGPPDGDIYSIHPDGTGLRRLTHFPVGTGVQLGSYSPDGKQIVFTTQHGATPNSGPFPWPDIFVMRADGSNVIPLTRTKNWEGLPQWRPAG